MASRKKEIENLLRTLEPQSFELKDMSASHKGHLAGDDRETHFRLLIVSEKFIGKSPVQRQRLVMGLVTQLWEQGLHALEIKALTPEENVNAYSVNTYSAGV